MIKSTTTASDAYKAQSEPEACSVGHLVDAEVVDVSDFEFVRKEVR